MKVLIEAIIDEQRYINKITEDSISYNKKVSISFYFKLTISMIELKKHT